MPGTLISIEQNKVELLSDDVQELIRHRPHWIVRKGTTILFLIILGLLAVGWFIQYPDVLKGSMKLAAINAPKLTIAQKEGKLQKLLVVNNQEVTAGQPMAFLESTASHEQVLLLQKWITAIEQPVLQGDLDIIKRLSLPFLNELGEIQTAYQEFQNSLKETAQLLGNGYYQQKKKVLQQDMDYLVALKANTQRQKQLLERDYELQQIEYNAKRSLAEDKIVAPLELNQDKSRVLNKEQGLEQMEARVIDNSMSAHNKRKEMLELQKSILEVEQKFSSSLLTLKSVLLEWMRQYIITAPVTGKVLFASFLQENQLVGSGQELFYVQPPQNTYYGELSMPQTGFGKVKDGQQVLIRVESFPSAEFGYLTGTVSYISSMPNRRDSFLIKVELPKGLQTNYGKTIFFRNNLSAQAEVITDDRRLSERLFGHLEQTIKR
jgi:HlyD family secretion protein